MDEYIGVIKLFAGGFAPTGFMFCQGQSLPVGDYKALYALIGNTYGGNQTQFNLPDLRGAVPVGVGISKSGTPYLLGNGGGDQFTQLGIGELPTHTHVATFIPSGGGTPQTATVTVNAGTGGTITNDPTNAYWGKSPGSGAAQSQDYTNQKNVQMASDAVKITLSGGGGITGGNVTNALAGLGSQFSNMPPYVALNYIICVQGIYPPQP